MIHLLLFLQKQSLVSSLAARRRSIGARPRARREEHRICTRWGGASSGTAGGGTGRDAAPDSGCVGPTAPLSAVIHDMPPRSCRPAAGTEIVRKESISQVRFRLWIDRGLKRRCGGLVGVLRRSLVVPNPKIGFRRVSVHFLQHG
jgi:hypothetical protein